MLYLNRRLKKNKLNKLLKAYKKLAKNLNSIAWDSQHLRK